MTYRSSWMTDDLDIFRDQFRRYLAAEFAPKAETWRNDRKVARAAWEAIGEMGALCPDMPEKYGGMGGTFAHVAAVSEDLEAACTEASVGVTVHNAIVAQYILAYGSEEQKKRWLPGMASGKLIGAIAMTEPGCGSDLQSMRTTAKKQGNHYVLNGAKTFITNGQLADVIIVAAKTDPSLGAKGISLVMLEANGTDGFRRGRNLDKIGLPASDTSELFFDDAIVPPENILGADEGRGFYQMMEQLPKERLGLAIGAVAALERALEITIQYAKDRKAFGQPIIQFQNTAFTLADLKTEALVSRVFVDWCIERVIEGKLDAVTASMAKLYTTERQCRTVDACLQIHGGYGYMKEYEIARRYVDARIQKIYGGTNEIMKLLISRSL